MSILITGASGNIRLKNSKSFKTTFCLPVYLGIIFNDPMYIRKILSRILNEKN